MPIDTGIWNLAGRGVKSVADYDNEYAQGQQNKLAMLTGQMKMDEYKRGLADDNQLRELTRQSGGDMGKLRDLTYGAGNYKQGMAIDKTLTEQKKAEAEAAKMRIETAHKTISLVGQILSTAKDQPSYERSLATAQSYGIDTSKSPPQFDPKLVAAKVQEAQTVAEQLAQKWKAMEYTTPNANTRLQADTSIATNAATNATSRANNASTVGATLRGQNMTDARTRETLQQGKVPQGYRQTEDGNLQAISGGPADLKMQGALNQDTQSLNSGVSAMDRLAAAANELKSAPGLGGVTGLRGAIPNIPGSQAANAEALLNTLKSQVAFGVLQDMRNNSKTGGALGNVSDAEGKRLEANLAALEKAQSYEQMTASLQKIIDYTGGAKDRLREAYNLKHNGKAGPVATAPTGGKPGVFDAADAILRGGK